MEKIKMNDKTTITLDRELKRAIAKLGNKGDSFERILRRMFELVRTDRRLFNEITKEEEFKPNVENKI